MTTSNQTTSSSTNAQAAPPETGPSTDTMTAGERLFRRFLNECLEPNASEVAFLHELTVADVSRLRAAVGPTDSLDRALGAARRHVKDQCQWHLGIHGPPCVWRPMPPEHLRWCRAHKALYGETIAFCLQHAGPIGSRTHIMGWHGPLCKACWHILAEEQEQRWQEVKAA